MIPRERYTDRDAEDHRTRQTGDGDATVEEDPGAKRQLVGGEGPHRGNSGGADPQAGDGSRHGRDHRLGHDLRHDVTAPGANRPAYRQFLEAAAGPDQKQVGDVRPADQQEDHHADLQEQEHVAHALDVIAVERHHDRSKTGGRHRAVGRIARAHRGVVRVDLSLRFGCGASRRQPRHHPRASRMAL